MKFLKLSFRNSSAILLVLTVFISMFAFSFTADAANNNLLTTAVVNMRASAAKNAKVLRTINKNVSVKLLSNANNGWAYVSQGSNKGYISTDYLKLASGSAVKMRGTTTDYVNLRKSKSTSSASLAVIPAKTTVVVTDNTNETWAKATYSGKTGFIKKEFLTVRFILPTAAKVTLNQTAVSLQVKGTFTVTAKNASGQAVTSGLKYTTSDKTVATVSAKGVITGVKAGTAKITVTDSGTGASATCTVTVKAAKVTLNSSSVTLYEGKTYQLTAKDAFSRTVSTLSCSTSVASVATVSAKGLVTAVKAGTAQITVKDTKSGASAKCTVTVKAAELPATAAPVPQTLELSAKSATVYVGCMYQILPNTTATATYKTSNATVAGVNTAGIVTAKAAGKTTITVSAGGKTATCDITVKKGTAVSISHTEVSVYTGKTFLAKSMTSNTKWISYNPDVAEVTNGFILGKKAGSAIICAYTATGATTCKVTVLPSSPVRFAYTSPNCAAKGQTVTLIAITDTKRTAVKFNVTVGSTVRTVNATSKTPDGNTLIWKGTTSFTSAGTYNVTAYAQCNYKTIWSTCTDAETTAFVANSTNATATVCANRRASDEAINLIANYEGFISSIYDDPITGDPTVGYGRVIYSGQQFYNAMTKNEAYAYLVQTVNNDGYANKVNTLLVGNKVKFNQQQFDALVSLVYNTGTGPLTSDTQLRNALLDCSDGTGTKSYYINGSYVRIRKGAGTNYAIIKELDYNTPLTVLSTKNSAWYQVQLSDGTKGYVSSDYISYRSTGGNYDLNYVDKQTLINKFCQYHHAGGGCIYGLLYRRVDEMEVFFYGDYSRNYGTYHYNIKFTCANNSSFHT